MKHEAQAVVNNICNTGKFSQLLASQDRDYLLSPTGSQVLYLSHNSLLSQS